MKDFIFETKHPLSNNSETMAYFLNEKFYEVFDKESYIYDENGSFATVRNGEGKLFGCHASGNGDFCNHKITFELICSD